MKKPMALSILLAISVSCSQVDPGVDEQTTAVGTWLLKERISGWTFNVTPVSELGYSESYEFNADGSFRKSRDDGRQAFGTFTTEVDGTQEVLRLIYTSDDTDLRSSCFDGEVLRFVDDNLRGGSNPCDGPDFVYKKVFIGN